jgi:hypothetical protein
MDREDQVALKFQHGEGDGSEHSQEAERYD